MIQRIQTVYLLVVVGLIVATLFLPLAVFQQGDALFALKTMGLSSMIGEAEMVYQTWGLFVVTLLIAVIAFVTIFLFKNRVLQMRLCVFNAILMLGFYGFFAYLVYSIKGNMEGVSMSVKFALSFPLIGLILDYLAIRNIGADEALVRSLDRLR